MLGLQGFRALGVLGFRALALTTSNGPDKLTPKPAQPLLNPESLNPARPAPPPHPQKLILLFNDENEKNSYSCLKQL